MPEITVLPVTRPAERSAFVEFPYRLYRGHPVWVPPLRLEQRHVIDTARHPFYRHAAVQLFLARRRSDVVGRIAAILDEHRGPGETERTGTFGFFESRPDQAIATALLDAARDWLRARGVHRMRGPLSPSINYLVGALVEGFDDPPSLGLPYNPPYYDALLTGASLAKAQDVVALTTKLGDLRSAKARRLARFGGSIPGARLRPYDPRRREQDIEAVWKLYSKAWTANWGSVPASLEEMRAIVADCERFADVRLVQFCEVHGEPVGLIVALPDLNQALGRANGRLLPFGWWRIWRATKKISRARVILLGVLPEWQGSALGALFLEVAQQPAADPYLDVEASWILESNHAALRGFEILGASVSKRYRIYEGKTGLPACP